jgi:DNA-binding NarL/FixJ family response regulator
MLSEVVQRILERQPNMNVMSAVADPVELLLAIKATKAEVLIITPVNLDQEPGICSYLLVEYPHLKILALSAKNNTAFLYKAGSCRKRIDDVGEELILSTMRVCIS